MIWGPVSTPEPERFAHALRSRYAACRQAGEQTSDPPPLAIDGQGLSRSPYKPQAALRRPGVYRSRLHHPDSLRNDGLNRPSDPPTSPARPLSDFLLRRHPPLGVEPTQMLSERSQFGPRQISRGSLVHRLGPESLCVADVLPQRGATNIVTADHRSPPSNRVFGTRNGQTRACQSRRVSGECSLLANRGRAGPALAASRMRREPPARRETRTEARPARRRAKGTKREFTRRTRCHCWTRLSLHERVLTRVAAPAPGTCLTGARSP